MLALSFSGCAAQPALNPETLAPTASPAATATVLPLASPAATASPAPTATPAPTTAAQPYDGVIAQYEIALKNNFFADLDVDARNKAMGQYIAEELKNNPNPVSYALCDLDGNGTQEMIIGAAPKGETLGNYDILGWDGAKAVRLFDMDFGYRTNFDVYTGGIIEVTWSESAFESGYDFYKVDGAKATLVCSVKSVVNTENTNEMLYYKDNKKVDQKAYDSTISGYESKGKQTLTWTAIADK
ncbi:MAG: hypothetical protein PHD32_11150 [Eubacteriales bacterium]|nr:hypothetical protein [Eubacteriales bacterium]